MISQIAAPFPDSACLNPTNYSRIITELSFSWSRKRKHKESCILVKYTSPDIQNELIELCGAEILNQLVDACKRSPCLPLLQMNAQKASKVQVVPSTVIFSTKADTKATQIRLRLILLACSKSCVRGSLVDLLWSYNSVLFMLSEFVSKIWSIPTNLC